MERYADRMTASVSAAPEDADWAIRFSRGEREAFAWLHEFHAPQLLAFLCSKCRGRLAADDVAQEVWLRIWKARGSFDGQNFRAWMFQITRNHLVTEYRRHMEPNLPDNYDVRGAAPVEEAEEKIALRECLRQVGGDFVDVLNAQLAGDSTEQIATRFQIKSATVYTRVDRAKKLIRDCVEKKLT